MRGSLGGQQSLIFSYWPSLSDFSESFVQDWWSPRTVGGCHSVDCVLTPLLSKKAEGHLLRIKEEMEEGSPFASGVGRHYQC